VWIPGGASHRPPVGRADQPSSGCRLARGTADEPR
jgi:hypothetical protein